MRKGYFLPSSDILGLSGDPVVFLILLLCWLSVQFHDSKRWYGIGFPFAALLMLYIAWRSMLVIYLNDGINWRGTHYSLKELKANKV